MTDHVLRDGCFSWVRAVSSTHGPPKSTTRHVLLALSLYMSPKGDSCFPSIDTLASDTGLSRKSVIDHLRFASELGWIEKRPQPMPGKGRGWKRMSYYATAPRSIRQKVVNLLHHPTDEGGEPDDEGGEPDGQKVVKDVHPMYSDDDSNDAHSAAASKPPSLQERTAKALASGKLNEWEEMFCRSKLARLTSDRELTGAMREKLLEILSAFGPEAPVTSVNVPSAAAQKKKTKQDLEHDEALIRERLEDDAHVPLDLAARCVRRRDALALPVPDWLKALSGERQNQETKQRTRSQKDVDAGLARFAKQGSDSDLSADRASMADTTKETRHDG